MALGEFQWCDLSTFHPQTTKPFYSELFGWSYEGITQPDGTPYDIAATQTAAAAGIFQMPPKFVKIGMPSFWMPYIEVTDIAATVETALSMGGRVEIGPIDWGDSGQIALIRDPLGAGFTVMQDGSPEDAAVRSDIGHPQAFALYVSEISAVQPFYEALFSWQFTSIPGADSLTISTQSGRKVAEIHELDESLRGKEQFWSITFAVRNLTRAKAFIQNNGGEILFEDTNSILAKDPDGAAFFISEAKSGHAGTPQPRPAHKWRTMLAIAAIYLAVIADQTWVWAVIFLLWTLPALRSGKTYFVEPLDRRENPALFWLLNGTWIGLALLLLWYGWSA